jgi:hypothetical protein
VSLDESEEEFQIYYNEMPWLALSYKENKVKVKNLTSYELKEKKTF